MGSPAPPECWERAITNRISNTSNAYESTLSSPMGATDTTASVVTTTGSPTSPCYLCIDPEVPASREYIYFDGTFTGTTFVTSGTGNRHLAGSAAGSGLTHDTGAVVRSVPAAQMFTDLHDRVTNHPHDGTTNGGVKLDHGAALTGLTDDDHTQYLLRNVLTTRGDMFRRGASAIERVAVGAANTVVKSDGTDPSWGKVVSDDITDLTIVAGDIANGTITGDKAVAAFLSSFIVTAYSGDVTSTIGTSEVVESTLTLAIPSDWLSYVVEIQGGGFIAHDGTSSGNERIQFRVRETDINGSIYANTLIPVTNTAPFQTGPIAILGHSATRTATGNKNWVLTSQITGNSGKYSMDSVRWLVRAVRIS